MDKQQAENLRILIRHMEGVARTLNMERVFYESVPEHDVCGTPACALGEATIVRGLRHHLHDWSSCVAEMRFGDKRVFGLSDRQADGVFGESEFNVWGRSYVTPQEWAIEARKVLAENGYSMEDKPAEFIERVTSWGPLVDAQPNWDNDWHSQSGPHDPPNTVKL